jgi:hypothetical protein
MASDKEVLDELEKTMQAYLDFMYDPQQQSNDSGKAGMSSFYMGMMMGSLAKRSS